MLDYFLIMLQCHYNFCLSFWAYRIHFIVALRLKILTYTMFCHYCQGCWIMRLMFHMRVLCGGYPLVISSES
jgi:hypothetical protein